MDLLRTAIQIRSPINFIHDITPPPLENFIQSLSWEPEALDYQLDTAQAHFQLEFQAWFLLTIVKSQPVTPRQLSNLVQSASDVHEKSKIFINEAPHRSISQNNFLLEYFRQIFAVASAVMACSAPTTEQAWEFIDTGLILGGLKDFLHSRAQPSKLLNLIASQLHRPTNNLDHTERGSSTVDQLLVLSQTPVLLSHPILDSDICVKKNPHTISADLFSLHSLQSGRPLLIKSFLPYQIQNQRSILEQLVSNSHRSVPVERGSSYSQSDWSIELITLGHYLRYILNRSPDIHENNSPLYLAQYPLHLHLNFAEPVEKIYDKLGSRAITNWWCGPAGSFSPYHADPDDNIFVQLIGEKTFQLLCPESSSILRTSPISSVNCEGGMLLNTTTLPDSILWTSAFWKERSELQPIQVTLKPGDALLIPKGWWHMVAGLTFNIGLSNWLG